MTRLDDAIHQALSEEDAKALERYAEDPTLMDQVLETFRGRMALLNTIGWVAGIAIFGLGVYCGWRFLTAPDVPAMLRWGGGAGLAALGVTLIKLWFWLELQSNAVIREVKRLELQIARLAAR
jgi:hypothetical protein